MGVRLLRLPQRLPRLEGTDMSDEIEVEVEIVPDEIEAMSDALADEEIIAEIPGNDDAGTRTIRVYDKARGDFTLDIPRAARVTFSYFNPAASGARYGDGNFGPGQNTMKTTALRIYERGEKSSQLACFMGVEGFRDLSLKLTRLRQRVTIESNFEDDGDGYQKFQREQRRMLNAASEDDESPF